VRAASAWSLAIDIVALRFTTTKTYTVIRGKRTDPQTIRLTLRHYRLPQHPAMLALLWVGALFYGFHQLQLIWLIPLMASLIFLLRDAFDLRVLHARFPMVPIEQSS